MDHVIYDFIGKLRVSERGYCFILIMVCVMTCFVFLKPLRTKSAKEVAFTLVNVFANFGVLWRRSLEIACQRRTSFRCKRNKGIYYLKFRCNQEGGG